MSADILERLELMLHARLTDEDTIIREAAAEIGRLRGEVARLEGVALADELIAGATRSFGGAIAPAEAKGDACPRCRGTGETCTGTIDGIPELFDCHVCLGSGLFTAPVGATIADAAGDRALTLDVARELLRDVAHGISLGRYNTPQPAGGDAVEPFGYAADVDPGDFDMSHTMYLLRPGEQIPAGCTALYTTPPAPVQAAPQEGEAVAYLEIGPGGYLDLGTDRSDDSLLSMPPGKYMLGIIGHPSGDAVGAALRFLGELETVGNARAGEVARGLRKVVANPSACELGADGVGLIAAERQRQISAEGWTPEHDDEHGVGELATAAACYAAPDLCRSEDEAPTKPRVAILAHWPWALSWWKPGDRIRELVKAGALIAAEIDRLQRAALQHRGDSQEVGRG